MDNTPLRSRAGGDNETAESGWAESGALVLVPIGYIFSTAATLGLVDPIKESYGNKYMVFLNAAIAMPGLPCALLQWRYDLGLDVQFGSFTAYQFRVITCFVGMLAITSVLIFERSRVTLMVISFLAAVFTWFAHGSVTSLVQLFPPSNAVKVPNPSRLPNHMVHEAGDTGANGVSVVFSFSTRARYQHECQQ